MMNIAAMWIGYAMMMVGAFVICLAGLMGAVAVFNKAIHMAVRAHGGWGVFLELRDWYHRERKNDSQDEG